MKAEEKASIVARFGLNPSDGDEWYSKYYQHVYQANRRGLGSNLTFDQYLQKAVAGGLRSPDQIGIHPGQFQLGRIGDIGNYEENNCRFITSTKNRQESHQNGCHPTNVGLEKMRGMHRGFTKETSESVRKMAETKTGRTKDTHAGIAAQADKLAKSFTVTDPNGNVHEGRNLSAFCEEHGLSKHAMYNVLGGRLSHHKGWTGSRS